MRTLDLEGSWTVMGLEIAQGGERQLPRPWTVERDLASELLIIGLKFSFVTANFKKLLFGIKKIIFQNI